MPSWLRNLVLDRTPSAAKALSGLNTDAKEPDATASGTTLLEKGRIETPELGPLAKLPPFAPVVIRLLRLFDRDDPDQTEIGALVEGDPALTAEILAVVNSPLYPTRTSITSPSHGVVMLGTDQMKALATTLAMRTMLSGSPRVGIVRRFWKHSVASAAIAQELAPAFGVEKGLGYTAAVMHDLGRIGLLSAHGEEYARLATSTHQSVEEILAVERAQFGMDHCNAGLLLARAWGLPQVFQDSVEHHHNAGGDHGAVGLVHLACRLADAFMFQSVLHRETLTPAETVETCVSKRLHEDLTGRLEQLKLTTFETIESLDF
jgi:putative nucleotidyltransferase with HDIG domain